MVVAALGLPLVSSPSSYLVIDRNILDKICCDFNDTGMLELLTLHYFVIQEQDVALYIANKE
jgi:hypothetical protein